MNTLSELRAEREALEREFLELERAIERLWPPLRLAGVTGEAFPEAVELAKRAAALLLRAVDDALAAMGASRASGRR